MEIMFLCRTNQDSILAHFRSPVAALLDFNVLIYLSLTHKKVRLTDNNSNHMTT